MQVIQVNRESPQRQPRHRRRRRRLSLWQPMAPSPRTRPAPRRPSASVSVQYIPRNMHTVFALLCFVVVIHWLIFLYPSGLLHWHCGNLTIAAVPAKQPWWIWINTSREFIMNDCITTTKQSTTKPCAYFLGYTVYKLQMTQTRFVTEWQMGASVLDQPSYWSNM